MLEAQRIVLLVDVVSDDRTRSLAPAELYERPELHHALKKQAVNSLLAIRDLGPV